MDIERIKAIANAVLYEGYMLYPYRPSALKNRSHGWSFGTLLPPQYVRDNRGESDFMQAQVLLIGGQDSVVSIEARFLQLGDSPTGVLERSVVLQRSLRELTSDQEATEFSFGSDGTAKCEPVQGNVEVALQTIDKYFKLTVRLSNLTPLHGTALTRDQALPRALVAAHALVTVEGGEFISLLDPPADLQTLACDCRQAGVFPVLVGEEGERSAMLLSPIILYDYPKIAAQSKGDFFDGSEIDEMLSLRVLTLSDAEKDEIRARGGPASQILERTEALTEAELSGLHGIMCRLTAPGAKP
jgi:hypothetical protein